MFGGTGFVGRHLASKLVKYGYKVVVPTRHPERHRHMLVLPGVELRRFTMGDERSVRTVLADCDTAINLIGILNERGHNGAGFRAAHVEHAERLVQACRESGVTRLIQISALNANANRGPSHYLRTKGQAEEIVRSLANTSTAYTILRPSVIFGHDDSFINRFAGLLRRLPVLPLAKPGATFAPVCVDDVTEAIVGSLADEAWSGETLELCGPEALTLLEIVSLIRDELQLKRAILPLPDRAAWIQAAACDYLVPGKPFSLDNYRSLTVASVCKRNDLVDLGIKPHGLRNLLPACLGLQRHRKLISVLQRRAGR